MLKKFLSRLFFSVLIVLALTFFVFALSNMIDGNAVDVIMGENPDITQEAYEAMVHNLGLDRPIPVRYFEWLCNFLKGDMGTSSLQNRPVSDLVLQRIGPTLTLTLTALVLSILIAVPLGIMSAYKPYSIWDNIASAIAFIGSSMPGFMISLFAIYIFAIKLKWLPTQGMYTANHAHTFGDLAKHLVMPALISGFQMVGNLLKQTRSAVLEVMNEDYIKTARSKGLSEFAVVVRHGLRNALIPIITTISLTVPFLVGGSVVIERIFSWPGMGSLIISSITARDFDPVMAAAMVICLVVLATNIILDFVYLIVDPRLAKEK